MFEEKERPSRSGRTPHLESSSNAASNHMSDPNEPTSTSRLANLQFAGPSPTPSSYSNETPTPYGVLHRHVEGGNESPPPPYSDVLETQPNDESDRRSELSATNDAGDECHDRLRKRRSNSMRLSDTDVKIPL